jgi:uncharacterized protein with HEPN domain
MQPENRDLAYLWDMREAARDVVEFVHGVSYANFCKDKRVRYAVERRIEVIGEAARHISETFKAEHSEIPWRQIIGQRNILAHEYGEILVERIWKTAQESIPHLLGIMNQLVPADENE